MKHTTSYLTFVALFVSLGLGIFSARAEDISFETTLAATTLNVETPFRCSVQNLAQQQISTTLVLNKDDFKLFPTQASDPLPSYEVNGWTFTNRPVDIAIQELVEEAKIVVYSEEVAYPDLNATDVFGELESVISELCDAADIFYRYDAKRQELYLSRRNSFELRLPDNRTVMLAILDALRGANIVGATPDWNTNSILLNITKAEKEVIEQLMADILKDAYILIADTNVYRLTPYTQATWQDVVNRFGASRVHASRNGLMGKMLTMGHQAEAQSFMNTLAQDFSIEPISQGIAIVPNGWKMRFEVGRCVVNPAEKSSLSILLTTQIQTPKIVDTTVTLDTYAGEVATFDARTAIDDELAIIGIPALTQDNPLGQEQLITLKLRLIRLITQQEQEGEK